MTLPIRRIALSTGGGDAPGLNAVLRAVVFAARPLGWEIVGIRDSFDGLLEPARYPDRGLVPLRRGSTRDIGHLGGTILGTTNRGNPFAWPATQEDGSVAEVDRSGELVRRLAEESIDAVIAIGGDGSLHIAQRLAAEGVRLIGVPKTIDNDLDSAVSFATECLDRLHATARSHGRVLVVEVMGRQAGWIALHAGIAGRADAILIPEIPYDLALVAAHLERVAAGRRSHAIVVVAEGARPLGGSPSIVAKVVGQAPRLGGIGERVAQGLDELTGKETRAVVLGHLLRGGSPTASDRVLAMAFGAAAVNALAEGQDGMMVTWHPPDVVLVPIARLRGEPRLVPVGGGMVRLARSLGISFGD
jgi:6-phosphofructokinase 1